VLEFLEYLQKVRGNAPRTRNARLTAIKSFMHFVEHRVPSALEQINRVLAIRDRAMLHVSITAGLRVSELVGLRLGDVSFESRYLNLHVCGKGRKNRLLTLWRPVAESVRAWLAVRGEAMVPELFLNAQGKAMTRAGFEYLLRKHATAASQRCPQRSTQRRLVPAIAAAIPGGRRRGSRTRRVAGCPVADVTSSPQAATTTRVVAGAAHHPNRRPKTAAAGKTPAALRALGNAYVRQVCADWGVRRPLSGRSTYGVAAIGQSSDWELNSSATKTASRLLPHLPVLHDVAVLGHQPL